MRFEQVERILNSDITIAEWCKLNKVAEFTMYHWLKVYRESNGSDGKRNSWIKIDRKEMRDGKALAVTNVSATTSSVVALDALDPATSQICARPAYCAQTVASRLYPCRHLQKQIGCALMGPG